MSNFVDHIKQRANTASIGIAFTLVFILLNGSFMASCSHDDVSDGILPPMEWKSEVHMDKHGKVKVPSRRGTYVFTCTNYNRVWIAWIQEKASDGTAKVYKILGENGDYTHMETPWGKVSAQKNIITVELTTNTSFDKRKYLVTVTEGDIFFLFTIEQEGV